MLKKLLKHYIYIYLISVVFTIVALIIVEIGLLIQILLGKHSIGYNHSFNDALTILAALPFQPSMHVLYEFGLLYLPNLIVIFLLLDFIFKKFNKEEF